jgi:hypothetical protein
MSADSNSKQRSCDALFIGLYGCQERGSDSSACATVTFCTVAALNWRFGFWNLRAEGAAKEVVSILLVLALQAGGDFAVDGDQRAEPFPLRVAGQFYRPIDHEYAETGYVPADFDWKRVIIPRDRGEKERPKLAIEKQRVVELSLAAVPSIADGLKLRRRSEQKTCF